jgi:prepilin-type processing-associated H-X9-DG protein
VVIGIIVILISLLLPLLIGAKRQAQQVTCAANLKQIGMAMTMYTNQYKYFPGARILLQGPGGSTECWPVRLRKFLNGSQKTFLCPAQDPQCEWKLDAPGSVVFAQDVHERQGYALGERLLVGGAAPLPSGPPPNGTFFSYGYNLAGSYAAQPSTVTRGMGGDFYFADGTRQDINYCRNVSSVKCSAEFIIIADSIADGSSDYLIRPFNSTPSTPFSDAIGNIHRGGANVLFLDGHVHWSAQRELLTKWPPIPEERAKQRLWNSDNLPAKDW